MKLLLSQNLFCCKKEGTHRPVNDYRKRERGGRARSSASAFFFRSTTSKAITLHFIARRAFLIRFPASYCVKQDKTTSLRNGMRWSWFFLTIYKESRWFHESYWRPFSKRRKLFFLRRILGISSCSFLSDQKVLS